MFRDAADLYVSLGFKVFPLAYGSKLPAIKGGNGFKDASDDPDQIDAWTKQFPRANIAIATGDVSGIVVIDIDPRNNGLKTINQFAARGQVFPPCPRARTGNGGLHLLFQIPKGELRKTIGEGVDIKGNGGYIVAAPSWLAPSKSGKGGTYGWLSNCETTPIPQLPAWALAAIVKPVAVAPRFDPQNASGSAERSVEGMARKLSNSDTGQRNDLLNWCAYQAGQLVREGKLGAGVVESRLTQAALATGLALPEIKATIASGLKGRGA